MSTLVVSLAALVDKAPPDSKVTAGWGAFAIFILLCVAVALLGWSLTRHLKKVQRNEELGIYDESTKPQRRTTI